MNGRRGEEDLAVLIERSAELKRDLVDFACSPRSEALRGYLRSESIAPLPLQRLAAAYPDTVDVVFRKILRRRDFTWTEHGEALMRRRKEWYYRREPRPGMSVIGDRLLELASGGGR